jgi:hypothetical protein
MADPTCIREPLVRREVLLIVALVLVMAVPCVLMLAAHPAEAGPAKDETFYLHNVTTPRQVGSVATLRIMDTRMGVDELNITVKTSNSVQDDWYLYPQVANDTIIEGPVTVDMWGLRKADQGNSPSVTMDFTLTDVDANGIAVAIIATGNLATDMITDWTEYAVSSGAFAPHTLASGHSLYLYFSIHGNSANSYQLAWGDSVYRSRMDLRSQDYVLVAAVEVLDHDGVAQTAFPSDVPDKDVTFHATVVDPFGGYDVREVWCTLTGPDGEVFIDHAPMTKVGGFFNTYSNEYALAWNYTGFPTGQYNVTVDAVDDTGWYYRYPDHPEDATYGGHLGSAMTTFWIGGLPNRVIVTVLDAAGAPLEGADVVIARYSGVTDAEGNVTLMVVNGTYELGVLWQDVPVYSEQVGFSGDTNLTVSVRVYNPSFTVLDDAGAPVGDAVVFIMHPNGTQLPTFWRTDAAGGFGLLRMAGGPYQLSVLWRGVTVFEGVVSVIGSGPFVIDSMVYTLAFTVTDDLGVPLDLAQVVVANTTTGVVTDSRMTDANGQAASRLPVGSYDIDVYWRDTLVYNDTRGYLLDASATILLRARVYTVEFVVIDTRGIPLENAMAIVKVMGTRQVVDLGQTDVMGHVSTMMPSGTFDFEVYWRDILVNASSGLAVSGNEQVTIVGSVFWVEVHVLDSRDVPVAAALVTFVHSTGQGFGTQITDRAGQITFRLPIGLYAVDVVWQESSVYDDALVISVGGPFVLHVFVYYIDLRVADTIGAPLDGATVEIWNASTDRSMAATVTNATGVAHFRLPTGTYRMLIVWSESPVFQGTLALRADVDRTIAALVYLVPFRTVDSKDIALEGATLQVVNSSTARPMGTQTTNATGVCVLRLPIGSYFVSVTWQNTNVFLSKVAITRNAEVVVHAAVYYLTFHIVDGDSFNLGNARLVVTNSTTTAVLGTLTTPDDGAVELRLPQGEIAFDVWWMTVKVNTSAGVSVHANDMILVKARVFHLTVKVIGADGVAVRGAKVLIERGIEVWSAGTTDMTGMATFRLPGGSYSINMTFKATYYLTRIHVSRGVPIGLTSSMTVEIKFKDTEYPIPWYRTTLFSVVFAYVLSVVVLCVVFYMILRRYAERTRDAKEAEAPAPAKEGDGKGDGKGEDGNEDDIDALIRDSSGKDNGMRPGE